MTYLDSIRQRRKQIIPPTPKNTPPKLWEALKAKPLEGEDYKAYTAKLGDKKERRGMLTGKEALKLPKDHETRQPHVSLTPPAWQRIGIETCAGKKFQLVALISRMEISANDLRMMGIDPALKIIGLTMPQALKIGAELDTVAQKFHSRK